MVGAPIISLSFNEQDTMLRTWGWRFDSFQRYHKEHAMKMTKALILTWLPSDDVVANFRADQERLLKLMEMELDGKTMDHRKVIRIQEQTVQRCWQDQSAVDEWIEFMQYLAEKYNGKVIVGELTDI